MNPHMRNAAIRCVFATIIIAAWVIWYDGPSWAWALLVGYVAFTFGMALFIQRKIQSLQETKERQE